MARNMWFRTNNYLKLFCSTSTCSAISKPWQLKRISYLEWWQPFILFFCKSNNSSLYIQFMTLPINVKGIKWFHLLKHSDQVTQWCVFWKNIWEIYYKRNLWWMYCLFDYRFKVYPVLGSCGFHWRVICAHIQNLPWIFTTCGFPWFGKLDTSFVRHLVMVFIINFICEFLACANFF